MSRLHRRHFLGTLLHTGAVCAIPSVVWGEKIPREKKTGVDLTPQDLLAILQAIKAAGALNAELEVI